MDPLRANFEPHYVRGYPGLAADWAATAEGRADLEREIVTRYELCRRHVVPWVARVLQLSGVTMLEVGCGTGAKSAAFAQHVARVRACDPNRDHVEAARVRMAAMGVANVELEAEDAGAFLARMRAEHPDGVDLCLLFAVLEHMTLEERLATMRESWDLLRPGGALVVLETPNRLLPWDWHSSRLPFFNMLPDELALKYVERSPRQDYVEVVRSALKRGEGEGLRALARQGRGVSYHEFELTIGPLGERVVADSYEVEILRMNPVSGDELALKAFLEREQLGVPAAFARYWLDLVLRKPDGDTSAPLPPPQALDPIWAHRVEWVEGCARLHPGSSLLRYPVPEGATELVLATRTASKGATLRVGDDVGRTVALTLHGWRECHAIPCGPGVGTAVLAVEHGSGPAADMLVEYAQAR